MTGESAPALLNVLGSEQLLDEGATITEHGDPRELDELGDTLEAIATGRAAAPPVHNLARQVVAALE